MEPDSATHSGGSSDGGGNLHTTCLSGQYEDAAGGMHDGCWRRGVEHGPGVHTAASGSVTEGTWADGALEGHVREVVRAEDGAEWHEECARRAALSRLRCPLHLPSHTV